MTKAWPGLPAITVVEYLGNHMFATLEVDFITEEMRGNMVKCKFVQDIQASTLAVSKMEFFMTLQLKVSICRLNLQRASSYVSFRDEVFPENKKIILMEMDGCFTGS